MGQSADKQRQRGSLAYLGWLAAACCLCLLYANELVQHLGGPADAAAPSSRLPFRGLQQQQQHHGSRVAAAATATAATGPSSLPAATLQHFPQAARCSTRWMQEYGQLHADILGGVREPRHFVSVAVEAGLADRLTGMMTQFWHAVLTRRAFSAVTYSDVPSFAAVCDAPFFDWATVGPDVPEAALEPLRFTHQGVRGLPAANRSLPASLRPADYQMLYLINAPARNLSTYQHTSLGAMLSPDPATILGASNRGRTFGLANNPWHKGQLWDMGVPPQDAFMCGFFALCSPVAAIARYYARFWEPLREPGVLKIGIQIRLGDAVFKQPAAGAGAAGAGNGSSDATAAQQAQVLAQGAEWFECAERLQAAYASHGQKVVWYLNSDSQALRAAAKQRYGAKLITDDELQMTHPDCFQGQAVSNASSSSSHGQAGQASSSSSCAQQAMDAALQHSLGAMLTFSLTDYHIITKASGFGRLGAWLSGRWGNVYQVVRGQQGGCVAGRPVPPEQSAYHYSGV
jgi:hypothetical protein